MRRHGEERDGSWRETEVRARGRQQAQGNERRRRIEEAYRIRRAKEARGTRRGRPCRKEMDDVLGASMSATGPEKDSLSRANAPEWGSLSRAMGTKSSKRARSGGYATTTGSIHFGNSASSGWNRRPEPSSPGSKTNCVRSLTSSSYTPWRGGLERLPRARELAHLPWR